LEQTFTACNLLADGNWHIRIREKTLRVLLTGISICLVCSMWLSWLVGWLI